VMLSRFGRLTVRCSIAAALLAGCGGSQPPIGAPGANPQTYALAHQLSNSDQPLLYVFGSYGSSNGKILDYPSGTTVSEFVPKPSEFVRTCSDSEGNVYLAGADETSGEYPAISEYTYGATSPSNYVVVTSQEYGDAVGCSVDPTTGNIAMIAEVPEKAVDVFAPQLQGTPQTFDSSMPWLLSAGYDNSGNLFLLGLSGHYQLEFAELPKGGSSFEAMSLDLGSHAPNKPGDGNDIGWTVEWDGQYVTIEGAYSPKHNGKPKTWKQAIYRLNISGSAATVAQTIFLRQPFVFNAAYWITPTLNSILVTKGSVREFDYPGGRRIGKLQLGGQSDLSTIALPPSR